MIAWNSSRPKAGCVSAMIREVSEVMVLRSETTYPLAVSSTVVEREASRAVRNRSICPSKSRSLRVW